MAKDLNGEYENFVHTGQYDYGEFFEQINFASRIVEKTDQNHLIQGLGSMFYQEFRDQFPDRQTRKNAFEDAKILVSGNKNTNYVSFQWQQGLFEAVKKAVSKGYIWDFVIDVPWHASFFFDEKRIYTFPFQHKFVVLYTGQAKHIFFDEFGKHDLLREDSDVNPNNNVTSAEEWAEYIAKEESKSVQKVREKIHKMCYNYEGNMPEGAAVNRLAKKLGVMKDYRNPDSILNEGALLTGNLFAEDYGQAEGAYEIAVWLAFIDKAEDYPGHDEGATKGKNHPKIYDGSVVLEVEVPSKWVAIKNMTFVSHPRLESVEDCLNSYNSPMEMSRDLSRDDEWVIPNNTGRLPVHYVKSVWDREEFNHPYFMSIQSFVDLMEQKYPKRMPSGDIHVEKEEISKKELKYLKKEFAKLEDIKNNCSVAYEKGKIIISNLKSLQDSIAELQDDNKKISRLERGEDEGIVLGIDALRDSRKHKIEDIVQESYYIFKNSRERNGRLKKIKAGLDDFGISFNIDEASLEQFVSSPEGNNQLPVKLIGNEIMSAHKKVAQEWEENKYESEMITEKMENDLKEKSSDLRKLNLSPKDIYQLLDTAECGAKLEKEIKNSLNKGYEKIS